MKSFNYAGKGRFCCRYTIFATMAGGVVSQGHLDETTTTMNRPWLGHKASAGLGQARRAAIFFFQLYHGN